LSQLDVRRYLCLSMGFAAAVCLVFAGALLAYLLDTGFSGWGNFTPVYTGWQFSPQASEIYFGISSTLFLAFLCLFIVLSRLPLRAKSFSIAAIVLVILNSFYIWTSGILYPQTNGLQNYVTGSLIVFIQVVTGGWAGNGLRFVDFGLPTLALFVGVCGAALGTTRFDRLLGFLSWTSIAVLPLGLECHFVGLGSDTVISYFGTSTSPLQYVTNDLVLYSSGLVIVLCVCAKGIPSLLAMR
jgi:hypothetical protein